jgi:hypothetical protein
MYLVTVVRETLSRSISWWRVKGVLFEKLADGR